MNYILGNENVYIYYNFSIDDVVMYDIIGFIL